MKNDRGVNKYENSFHYKLLTRISHFYDKIGLQSSHGLLNINEINSIVGTPIVMTYFILKPYIAESRLDFVIEGSEKDADIWYQKHFEHLASILIDPPNWIERIKQRVLKVKYWLKDLYKLPNQKQLVMRYAYRNFCKSSENILKAHPYFKKKTKLADDYDCDKFAQEDLKMK